MPRVLFLVRHADSQNLEGNGHDRNRDLTDEGVVNAKLMASRLRERGIQPERIFVSPAKRAQRTAEILAEGIGSAPESIETHPRIYEATARILQDIINGLSDDLHSVMMVGHNPAVSRIVAQLTKETLDNMPPTGVVCLEFEAASWSEIGVFSGHFAWYDFPQNSVHSARHTFTA